MQKGGGKNKNKAQTGKRIKAKFSLKGTLILFRHVDTTYIGESLRIPCETRDSFKVGSTRLNKQNQKETPNSPSFLSFLSLFLEDTRPNVDKVRVNLEEVAQNNGPLIGTDTWQEIHLQQPSLDDDEDNSKKVRPGSEGARGDDAEKCGT